MILVRKFIYTILVQSFGPASLFFAVWFIAIYLGPEAQGKFSAVKAFVELLVALALFGMPQSFVYGINLLGVQRGQIMRWTLRYGFVSFVFVGFLLMFLRQMEWTSLDLLHGHLVTIAFLIVAIACRVTHGLLRGIFLTINDGWLFSLLTILPAFSLGAAVVALVSSGQFEPALAYAISGAISSICAVLLLRRCCFVTRKASLPWAELLVNGCAVYFQGLFMAAQPFLTLTLIHHYGGNYEDIAFFSLAMYIYQAGLVPLVMVAPILFNRWTCNHSLTDKARDVKHLLWGLFPITLLLGGGWFLVPVIVSGSFGISYKEALPTIQVMLLAIPLLYIGQVGMPVLMSLGMFKTNVFMVAIRLIVCVVSLFALLINAGGSDLAKAAAQAWVLAEFALASLTVFFLIRNLNGSSCKEGSICQNV